MTSKNTAITIKNLSAGYQDNPVLQNINLSFALGKKTAIIGPNGAGKSTLLKSIMRLIPSQADELLFLGKPLKEQYSKIAYVPQRAEVDWDFPITVLDVVLMGAQGRLKFWQRPTPADKQLALDCLEKLAMHPYLNRQISELSGGQQQRVFIARALMQQAEIYLLDEPFAGVDMATEKTLVEIFNELKSQGKTLISVHHDLNTLKDYFDEAVMVNQGIIAFGALETCLTKENLEKTYLGRLPILEKLTAGQA